MTDAPQQIKKPRSRRKLFITLGALGAGLLAIVLLFVAKPEPEKVTPEIEPPGVRVAEAELTDTQLTVVTQGTVRPLREINLVPEVSGKVVDVADNFVVGGYFDEGDVLVRIDPRDFRFQVVRAEAQVASARQRLALEEAEAEQARRDWQILGDGEPPSDLVLREPQLKDVRANLRAAEAQLAEARLNLERTEIRAPFDGRVRSKVVDMGQFVAPGNSLGEVYSTDVAEVRLPLTDRQISYLDLPLGPGSDTSAVPVTVKATFSGREYEWPAVIRRTEGAIDPRTRVLYAIAEVDDPFGRKATAPKGRPPLAVGLFIEAEITGRKVDKVLRLPREALRERDQLLVVGRDNRLEFTEVDVLRATSDGVLIESGLAPGARVVVSPLENAVDGMEVKILGSAPGAAPGAIGVGGGPR